MLSCCVTALQHLQRVWGCGLVTKMPVWSLVPSAISALRKGRGGAAYRNFQLHKKFKASLDYMICCLKRKWEGKDRRTEGGMEGGTQASKLPLCQVRLPHQARPTFSDHTSKNILSDPSIQMDSKCTHLPRQRPISPVLPKEFTEEGSSYLLLPLQLAKTPKRS